MFIIYLYDLKAKNKKKFNRTKRMFYYYLNRLPLPKEYWKSKSALSIPPKLEKTMDSFFKQFRNEVVVYKLHTQSIEELE